MTINIKIEIEKNIKKKVNYYNIYFYLLKNIFQVLNIKLFLFKTHLYHKYLTIYYYFD